MCVVSKGKRSHFLFRTFWLFFVLAGCVRVAAAQKQLWPQSLNVQMRSMLNTAFLLVMFARYVLSTPFPHVDVACHGTASFACPGAPRFVSCARNVVARVKEVQAEVKDVLRFAQGGEVKNFK